VAEIKAQVDMQSGQAKLALEREKMQLDHTIELEKLNIEKEKVQVDVGKSQAKITSEEVLADAGRRETRRIERERPRAPTTQ
jgi:hypothetical protein